MASDNTDNTKAKEKATESIVLAFDLGIPKGSKVCGQNGYGDYSKQFLCKYVNQALGCCKLGLHDTSPGQDIRRGARCLALATTLPKWAKVFEGKGIILPTPR